MPLEHHLPVSLSLWDYSAQTPDLRPGSLGSVLLCFCCIKPIFIYFFIQNPSSFKACVIPSAAHPVWPSPEIQVSPVFVEDPGTCLSILGAAMMSVPNDIPLALLVAQPPDSGGVFLHPSLSLALSDALSTPEPLEGCLPPASLPSVHFICPPCQSQDHSILMLT